MLAQTPEQIASEAAELASNLAKHGPLPTDVCVRLGEIMRAPEPFSPTCGQWWQYIGHMPRIPGAPAVADLKPEDAPGLLYAHTFDLDSEANWAGLVAWATRMTQSGVDSSMIGMPIWQSKNPARPNMFISSLDSPELATKHADGSIEISRVFQREFNDLIRPYASGLRVKDHKIPAPADKQTMVEIVQAIASVNQLMGQPLGELELCDATFRLSVQICLLAGLGSDTLQAYAKTQADADWASILDIDHAELLQTISDARVICGFPLALLLVDPIELIAFFARHNFVPWWLRIIVALHFLRHVRRDQGIVRCAYKGKHAELKINDGNTGIDLGAIGNEGFFSNMCRVLGISSYLGRGQNIPPVGVAIRATVALLHVANFSFVRRMPHVIGCGDAILYESCAWKIEGTVSGNPPWVDTGLKVTKFSGLNVRTGDIDTFAQAIGIEVIAYPWPLGLFSHVRHSSWIATLPKKVDALLPSEFEKKYAPHINRLGHDVGHAALIDAKANIDLFRDDLSGTKIGSGIGSEYPISMVIPSGNTRKATTNHGKTTLERIRQGAIIPSIAVLTYTAKTGIPGARVFGDSIRFDGGAILDEVNVLPKPGDFFLDQIGIQGWATGSLTLPGGVGEKSTREKFRPRIGPSIVTKAPWIFPLDVLNRAIVTAVGEITAATTLSGDELTDITTGAAALQLRFSMILYAIRHGVLDKLRAISAPERGSALRFPWHLAACRLFTPDHSLAEVQAYTEAALRLIETNKVGAKSSGLSDDLGHHDGGWDVVAAFKDAADVDLQGAFPPPPAEGDRRPVIGWRAREFVTWLRDRSSGPINLNIQKYAGKLMEAVRDGYMVREDGIFLTISADKGRRMEVVRINVPINEPPKQPTGSTPFPHVLPSTKVDGYAQVKIIAENVVSTEVKSQDLDRFALALAKQVIGLNIRNKIQHYVCNVSTALKDISDAVIDPVYSMLREHERFTIDDIAAKTAFLEVKAINANEVQIAAKDAVRHALRGFVRAVVVGEEIQSAIASELADGVRLRVESLIAQGHIEEARQECAHACSIIHSLKEGELTIIQPPL